MNWLSGSIIFILGLASGVSTRYWFPANGAVDKLKLALALALPGAAGGLLASLATNDGLRLPRRNPSAPEKLEVGFIADILFGVAGGMLLFVIIPGTINHATAEDWLKLCGLAMVLGFAGRGVVSSAADQQMKQFKQRADQLEKSVAQQNTNTQASGLMAKFLQDPAQDTPDHREELAKALKSASSEARANLFSEAERYREENWKQAARFVRGDTTADGRAVALLERTAFIFKNLYEADVPPIKHRVLASLGYTQYDLKRPADAITSLTKAIEIGAEQHDPAHPFYHFTLALAYLDQYLITKGKIDKADPELRQKVQPNLEKAVQLEPYVKTIVDEIQSKANEADVANYDRSLWSYLH